MGPNITLSSFGTNHILFLWLKTPKVIHQNTLNMSHLHIQPAVITTKRLDLFSQHLRLAHAYQNS